MIFLGLGANLPSERFGTPISALKAAISRLSPAGIEPVRRSSWFETAPVPVTDQPWFVNAVVEVRFGGTPQEMLARLHEIEAEIGRIRQERWGPRIVDLDLLCWHDTVIGWPLEDPADPETGRGGLIVPHPRAHLRAFVLAPLGELAPEWRHPVLHCSAAELLARLPAEQEMRRVED